MDQQKNDTSASKTAAAVPVHESRKLMGEGREAVIVHNGESYRLRVTANDRLILTK